MSSSRSTPMPDERTLVEKLTAMANQTASPEEAIVARRMLARLKARGPQKDPRVLTREEILEGTPTQMKPRGLRVKFPDGTWVHMDEDTVDWDWVERRRLWYRFDGETAATQAKPFRKSVG